MATGKYDGWIVEILNWEKYNPRAETKQPTWFRCQNDLFFSPTFSDLDAQELCVALFLMCEVSRRNGQRYTIKMSHVARHARTDLATVESALEKLKAEGFFVLQDPMGSTEPGDCSTPSPGSVPIPHEGAQTRTDPCEPVRDADEGAQGRASPCDDMRLTCPTLRYGTLRDVTERNEEERKEVSAAPENSGAPPPAVTIPEFSDPPDIRQTLLGRKVSLDAQKAWLQAYPDAEWIKQEIRKAVGWEIVNPGRRKKHFARFIGRWLSRGWDSRRAPPGRPGRAEARSQANQAALATYLESLGGNS